MQRFVFAKNLLQEEFDRLMHNLFWRRIRCSDLKMGGLCKFFCFPVFWNQNCATVFLSFVSLDSHLKDRNKDLAISARDNFWPTTNNGGIIWHTFEIDDRNLQDLLHVISNIFMDKKEITIFSSVVTLPAKYNLFCLALVFKPSTWGEMWNIWSSVEQILLDSCSLQPGSSVRRSAWHWLTSTARSRP